MKNGNGFLISEKIKGRGLPLIEGLPDVGLVGTIASSYFLSSLQSELVGHIEIDDLPPIVTIQSSKILEPCRLYLCSDGNVETCMILSDVPVPSQSIWSTANSILEIGHILNSTVISVGGIPEPNRLDIEKPEIYVVSNDEDVQRKALETGYSSQFENGFITGMKAALLRNASRKRVKVLVALAQSHMNYPDPGAAAEVVVFLNKFLGLNVSVEPLREQAERLKMQLRDLMRRTTASMARIPKGLELETTPHYIR
ncbi:MAG: PAC2 family protein [Nitrososphaerota archaeon]